MLEPFLNCDAAFLSGGEMPFHPIGQFVADMVVYLIMRCPRPFGRIEVKSRALSDKFVRAVADMAAARRGVGENDDDVPLRGSADSAFPTDSAEPVDSVESADSAGPAIPIDSAGSYTRIHHPQGAPRRTYYGDCTHHQPTSWPRAT